MSRNVVFYEKHFPYHFSSNISTQIFLPISTPIQPFIHDDIPSIFSPPTSTVTDLSLSPSLHPSPSSSLPSSSYSSSTSSTHSIISSPPPRRSTRAHVIPKHLQDFVCNTASFCNLVTLSTTLFSTSGTHDEPSTYHEASHYPHWVNSMDKKLTALAHNNITWELVPLPQGKKSIGSKWVFEVKLNADGSLERYKARLVAKGYNQKEGID